MQRVVVVSEVFPPEQTATAVFAGGMALALARRWPVEVVAGQMRYPDGLASMTASLVEAGVRVLRPPGQTTRAYRIWSRGLQVIESAISLLVGTWRVVNRGDVVIVTTNPPLAPILAALVARLRGAKLVVRIDDLYPDALAAVGLISEDGLVARCLRWFLDIPLKTADAIIVLGRDVQARVAQRRRNAIGVHVIRNWWTAQISDTTTAAAAELRKGLGICDELVVGYLGTFGRTHDLSSILMAARVLLQQNARIRFVLMGQGARFEEVLERVQREDLRNVIVRPSCRDEELAAYLQLADVALISFPPGMVGVSVPSRMYNHLVAARPILGICDEESELAQTILESRVGWIVQPGSTTSLVASLQGLEGRRDEVVEAGNRARQMALAFFSYERAVLEYEALVEQVIHVDGGKL